MDIKNKGFAPILIVIIAAVIGTVIFLGIKSDQPKQSTPSPTPTNTPLTTPTALTSGTPIPKTLIKGTTSPKPVKTFTPVPVPTMHQVTVSGFAYEDRNDNGIMDSDDPKLPNMQIYFYDVAKPSVQINTVFTDANGNFSNTIDVIQGIIVKPTTYNNFRPRGDAMTFAGNYNGIQIGFRSASAPAPNLNGILEGIIFKDANSNSVRDSGEASTYFYKLYLLDASGNYYNTVEGAQATDAGGHFKFANLPTDRTFTIRLSNPDVNIPKTEYQFSLNASHTQETNIEIPIN